MKRGVAGAGLALIVALVPPPEADAQGLRDRIRQRAQEQVERRIEQRAEQAVESGLNRTEDAIRCVAGDAECASRARAEGREVVYVDADGIVLESSEATNGSTAIGPGTPAGRVGEGAWANYDFVPGDRLLFAEDFTADRVGNFPRRLDFVDGAMELVEMQGGRFLRATSDARFEIVLPERLPERFTMEFDAHLPHWWHQVYVAFGEPDGGYRTARTAYNQLDRYALSYVQLSRQFEAGVRGEGGGEALAAYAPLVERIVPVRIMADGTYVKVFLDERRVANVPNANLGRSTRIGVFIAGEVHEDRPVFLGNFRVAAGGPSLYDALEADGRVTTQGILFDSGSDRIRPESTPTLVEIGRMLEQHGSLRLRIEGHTDSTGDAGTNQQLSEQRAAAVRAYLVERHRIDGGRLEAVGMGQSEPADTNVTPEGRQNNRRVVLVRL
jgi:OmpA-OmpF porin, OOP family